MRVVIVVASACIACSTASVALGFGIRGFVVGNGGWSATPSSNGAYKLYGTVGGAVGRSDNADFRLCSGFWCFGGSRVLDAGEPAGASVSGEFALGLASPNPARGQTRFRLALPTAATVTLSVYDVGGREVGTTITEWLDAGDHEMVWRPAGEPAGVYFAQVRMDGAVRARRMFVLVR